jgi:ABC-2 type transport system permease protein
MPDTDRLPGAGRILVAQIGYQLTLIARTARAFIFGLVMPAALLALEVGHRHVGNAVLTGTVAGLIVFGTLSIAYLSYAAGLVAAREDGVLRRWHAMPLPAWAYFAGRITATVLMADAAGIVLLLVAIAMSGLHITLLAAACLILANTVGALALATVGTAITPVIPTTQGANGMLALTYLPLLLFSGGFGNVSGLPHWVSQLMTYLPVRPVIDAATLALQHPGAIPGRDLAILGAWIAACLLLAIRTFRWEPHRPRHAHKTPTPAPAAEPAPAPAAEPANA